MNDVATLERRLARFRATRLAAPVTGVGGRPVPPLRGPARAARLAEVLDGHVVGGPDGLVVRVEPPTIAMPLDRERLARLPGQPGPEARLVCLDTETTGLGTAAGTLAFLVGLGWWEGDRFRRLQLVCPDHGEERALLAALEQAIPADAWLVTYNGRGFDWPLLVTRYRLHRRAAPPHAGMLDLLPGVRRLFRHRIGDARLSTVERELLGVERNGDVGGREIPGRYLDFVRGGPAGPLAAVLWHNAEDVASLARLLAHLDARYADPEGRALAPPGDLVALARAYTRDRRHEEALGCLNDADAAWLPASLGSAAWPYGAPAAAPATVSRERIRAERARTLRRLGRTGEALAAWEALAADGGAMASRAWVEAAKVREHTLRDPAGALRAAEAAARAAERSRLRWGGDPDFEAALATRLRRLRRRTAGRISRAPTA
ncbi:MAG TPA: ribonuclease H-like domain-containing protein [Candidatus Nanopelagicales bacterium]|nr:ribonuclease H-like domain-containing protein [Candidatus Nanopelagicales bacterium]